MSDYPEHEKLKALDGKNNVVEQFLEWLSEQQLILCHWHETGDDENPSPPGYHPAGLRMQQLIAQHFGIDEQALERERRAVLRKMRDDQDTLNRNGGTACTRLVEAQAQFIKWIQLRPAMGKFAHVDGSTLGSLIDCATAYIERTEATESAEFLKAEKEES